jgi:chorismate mutase/prephenate dehydratase
LFFIDIEGHQNNDNVKGAISKIKSKVSKLEILGSYPIAVL